jgi:NADH:ubiquinone oxidoreductase subunit 4 (subunit M)
MSDFLLSIGYRSWALDMLMALPLAAALIVLLSRAEHAKWIALWVTLAEFVISSGLWWAFEPGTAAMQFEVRHAWIPDWGITYYLGVDGISLFMVLLTTFTMPLAVLGSFNYIKQHERSYYALLASTTSNNTSDRIMRSLWCSPRACSVCSSLLICLCSTSSGRSC